MQYGLFREMTEKYIQYYTGNFVFQAHVLRKFFVV